MSSSSAPSFASATSPQLLDEAVAFIADGGYRKVALQFPDEMLGEAFAWTEHLERSCPMGTEFYTLADTSYGSCCVDEVAAEHVNCDALIHFGDACLSPVSRLPVHYVFPAGEIRDYESFMAVLIPAVEEMVADRQVLVFGDLSFDRELTRAAADLAPHTRGRVHACAAQPHYQDSTMTRISGRSVPELDDATRSQTVVVFLGPENSPFYSVLCLIFNDIPILQIDPATASPSVNRIDARQMSRRMTKRFLSCEKVKEANVVGLLVGTLSVAMYGRVIDHLQRAIKLSGRHCCVVSVGKLNPAKLANFPEVDVFVNVACMQSTLVDCREFLQPVVTPYELVMALTGDEWVAAGYELDFSRVLRVLGEGKEGDTRVQNDEPVFSLASGRLVSHGGAAIAKDASSPTSHDESASSSLIKRDDDMSGALMIPQLMDALSKRTWTGLDLSEGSGKAEPVELGRSGIASRYE